MNEWQKANSSNGPVAVSIDGGKTWHQTGDADVLVEIKRADGTVELRGAATHVFTLPEGFRPSRPK